MPGFIEAGLILEEAGNLHALVAPRRGFVSAAFTAWGVFSPQKSMTFPNVAPFTP